MIRTLRAFFLARLLREKILLVALVTLAVALWLSGFARRAGGFWAEASLTSEALEEQSRWVANRAAVEKAAQRAAGRFDPAQTLDGTRLLAAVSGIARDAGLRNYSTGSAEDAGTGQFAVHTLQFSVLRVPWSVLENFCAALQQRSPYIAIEQFSVAVADRGNTNVDALNVSMRVSSVEIIKRAP